MLTSSVPRAATCRRHLHPLPQQSLRRASCQNPLRHVQSSDSKEMISWRGRQGDLVSGQGREGEALGASSRFIASFWAFWGSSSAATKSPASFDFYLSNSSIDLPLKEDDLKEERERMEKGDCAYVFAAGIESLKRCWGVPHRWADRLPWYLPGTEDASDPTEYMKPNTEERERKREVQDLPIIDETPKSQRR